MNKFKVCLFTVLPSLLLTMTAFGTATNPDSGDNSVVPLAIGIAVAVMVIFGLVMFFTRDKKK